VLKVSFCRRFVDSYSIVNRSCLKMGKLDIRFYLDVFYFALKLVCNLSFNPS